MADLSSLKGSSDIVDTTSPLNTQPSAIPHGVKMSILDCSRKAIEGVKNAVNACLLAGTLAMGAAPAMAEGAPVVSAETLQTRGFSDTSTQGVLALSRFVQEKQAQGWLAPTEAVRIETVSPLMSNGSGLEQLVNTGSRLPKKTFNEVTSEAALSGENYTKVVDALFDTTDIEMWLTKSDGTAMSAQEIADYKESMVAAKKRWLAKLPEFVTAGKNDIIVRWFDLFNALATKPTHGSREEYRRGLIAANSMANYMSISPDKQKLFAPATITQAAEYVFMTDPTAQMVKIERSFTEPGKPVFTLKYLLASDASLTKAGFIEGIGATHLALQWWNADQVKKYTSYKDITAIKTETAAIKTETAAIKTETAAIKTETAALDTKISTTLSEIATLDTKMSTTLSEIAAIKTETATLDTKISTTLSETTAINTDTAFMSSFIAKDKEFNALSRIILQQLNEFNEKRGDKTFVVVLNKNLQAFRKLKWELEKLALQDSGKQLIAREWKDLMGKLYATIMETVSLKKVPENS